MVSVKHLSTSLFLHLLILLSFLMFFRLSEIGRAKYIEIDLEAYSGSQLTQEKSKQALTTEKTAKVFQLTQNQPDKSLPVKEEATHFIAKEENAVSEVVPSKESRIPKETFSQTSSSHGSGSGVSQFVSSAKERTSKPSEGQEGFSGYSEKKDQEKIAQHFLSQKFSIISDIVRKHLQYPYLARRMGWEGKVVISFVLTRQGEVKEVRVVNSSGYKVLDENTLATLQGCAKYFPVPPVDVKITLPVVYRLN
ncbi:energy transducer TonB [Thermodesulfobacterium hveragerdense]|uniref:energy transducer TonB n=1 Tax=Thermodesulfobacterium hveragerdense TaxID=53424 RepID=UPI00040AA045|nr:energy transducer TonB [Thermodesulfobacterium hveragerdense]